VGHGEMDGREERGREEGEREEKGEKRRDRPEEKEEVRSLNLAWKGWRGPQAVLYCSIPAPRGRADAWRGVKESSRGRKR
jgi:hypothetical protein